MDKFFSFDINQVRLFVSVGLLATLIILESTIPWRKRQIKRSSRWFQNLSLTVFNSVLAKLTLGFLPLAVSYYCYQHKFGLFHWIHTPNIIHIVLSYVVLDLLIYLQHIWFHFNPVLWRLHKVHHSDPDLDVTSGFRFHPVEILLSLALKSLAIFILGAHPMGVLIFEVLLNAGSLFNHSNIMLNHKFDYFLKKIVVTPSFHLVHHSTKPSQTNSNFGFTISIWDYIFKTFRSSKTPEKMIIGLNEYSEVDHLTIQKLLKIPFESPLNKTEQNNS